MKIKRSIIPFLLFVLVEAIVVAQPVAKLKEDGLNAFEKGKYGDAFQLLTRYEQQKAGEPSIQTALGIAAFEVNKMSVAKQYLQLALNGKKIDPSVFLYLGRVAHSEYNFKEAIIEYKKFLRLSDDKNPQRRRTISDIQRCANARKISFQPELALVENLGEAVNSRFDEFDPIQSPNFDDRIYFTSAREDSEGGLRDNNCLVDVKNGHYFQDIYATEVEGTDWRTPSRIENTLINSTRHEQLLDITNNGKALIFFRSLNGFSGDILVDTFKQENEIRGLPPTLNVPMKPENGDNSLCFFNDTILIFAARRSDAVGGSDLYFSIFQNNSWTEPVNLGKNINTTYDETSPFLAKDGRTLYFSSNSTQSMGGFDVFKSVYDEDSLRFMPPVNLGKPINSSGDDMFFRLTPDGTRAYFCSSRKESYGQRDIYNALFKAQQKSQTPSMPMSFHLVEAYQAAIAATKIHEEKIPTIALKPLFYDSDDDLLRGVNLTQLRLALNTIKQFPSLKIVLTGNSAAGEKSTFDLYFTMKRVEKIAKYLIDNGLQNEQIVIKSVGSEYPIAQTIVDGQANTVGEKLNRRIDMVITNLSIPPVPIKITYELPIVSEFMVNTAAERFEIHKSGLSYKIHILTSKRIYDNEILIKYGDPMIETSSDGNYLYSVGLFSDYNSAAKLRSELLKINMREALIIPYVNGVRLSDDVSAKTWSTKYADLLNYLAAKKKP